MAEHLHNVVGAKTLFATHYHELTELAATLPRVKNYNVAVREWHDQVIFLHKILPGGTDKSYGIQVARLAGLPKEVVARAKEVLANLEESEISAEGNRRSQSESGERIAKNARRRTKSKSRHRCTSLARNRRVGSLHWIRSGTATAHQYVTLSEAKGLCRARQTTSKQRLRFFATLRMTGLRNSAAASNAPRYPRSNHG